MKQQKAKINKQKCCFLDHPLFLTVTFNPCPINVTSGFVLDASTAVDHHLQVYDPMAPFPILQTTIKSCNKILISLLSSPIYSLENIQSHFFNLKITYIVPLLKSLQWLFTVLTVKSKFPTMTTPYLVWLLLTSL